MEEIKTAKPDPNDDCIEFIISGCVTIRYDCIIYRYFGFCFGVTANPIPNLGSVCSEAT